MSSAFAVVVPFFPLAETRQVQVENSHPHGKTCSHLSLWRWHQSGHGFRKLIRLLENAVAMAVETVKAEARGGRTLKERRVAAAPATRLLPAGWASKRASDAVLPFSKQCLWPHGRRGARAHHTRPAFMAAGCFSADGYRPPIRGCRFQSRRYRFSMPRISARKVSDACRCATMANRCRSLRLARKLSRSSSEGGSIDTSRMQ